MAFRINSVNFALYWWTVKDLKRVEKELGDFVNPYPFYLQLRFDI